jgi:hypothetical protein
MDLRETGSGCIQNFGGQTFQKTAAQNTEKETGG